MAKIQIQALSVGSWQDANVTELRLFCSNAFTTSDGIYIPQGGVSGDGRAYKTLTLTYNSSTDVLTIPQFLIDSTTDGQDFRSARYTAALYDSTGAFARILEGFDQFAVPSVIATSSSCIPSGASYCCTWAEIRLYNTASIALPFDDFYTKTEINRLLTALDSSTWGEIGGTLSDQTDLQAALDAKQDTGTFVTSLNSLTGALTLAVGSGGTDFAAGASGATITLNLPDASATARGALTTGTQTIAGAKTFTGAGIFSSSLDAIIKSTTKAGLPTAGSAGHLGRVSDDVRGLWLDNGTTWYPLNNSHVSVDALGAVGDALSIADGSISNGGNFSTPSYNFSSADIGKKIAISNGTTTLATTITGASSNAATLQSPWSGGTVTGSAIGVWGTDDTTAIQNTIDTKGVTVLGSGKCYLITSTLTLGNGSSSVYSTNSGYALIGGGAGSALSASLVGYPTIVWGGAASATMVKVNGPISHVRIQDVGLNCAKIASTGLDLEHPQESHFRNINISNNTGVGLLIQAYTTHAATTTGGTNNHFDGIVVSSLVASATGCQYGKTTGADASTLDVAQNKFTNCKFVLTGATTTGLLLSFCDSTTFDGGYINATIGLKVTAPSGTQGASYPSMLYFNNVPIIGGQTITNTWTPTDKIFFSFHDVVDSGTATPTDTGFAGLTSRLTWFGAFTFRDAITFANTGLRVQDTDASHSLLLVPGSNLTANRTLTITTGDVDRTLNIAGSSVIAGTNTGDQTISLTGDVTGSGTSSFAASIAAQASSFWAGKVTDETGSGAWVFNTSPTFTADIRTPQIYGGTSAGSTLTLSGTSNGSPSNAHLLLNTLAASGATRVGGVFIGAAGSASVDSSDMLHLQGPDAQGTSIFMDSYGTTGNPQWIGRRARGTGASPSGVLANDVLLGIVGIGYHSSAAFPSVGSASIAMAASETHTTTAKGAYVDFYTTPNGTTSVSPRWRIEHGGWLVGQELSANPTTSELAAGNQAAIYVKADKLVIAYNQGGTIKYIVFALDGSTTSFTNSSSAP